MKNYWHLNNNADISETSLKLEIKCNYEHLIELFGAPAYSSSIEEVERETEKTLCEWVFENQHGKVVTLYDWKGSSLRNEFHIGAHDATTAHLFEIWLSAFQKREIEKQKIRA